MLGAEQSLSAGFEHSLPLVYLPSGVSLLPPCGCPYLH